MVRFHGNAEWRAAADHSIVPTLVLGTQLQTLCGCGTRSVPGIGDNSHAVREDAAAARSTMVSNRGLTDDLPDGLVFGPPAESLSLCPRKEKVTKEKARPDIRVCPLRGQTSLTPVLLRRPAQMGHPWPNSAFRGIHAAHLLRSTCARPSVRGVAFRVVCTYRSTDRSHARRGDAVADAPRLWSAERPWRRAPTQELGCHRIGGRGALRCSWGAMRCAYCALRTFAWEPSASGSPGTKPGHKKRPLD